MKNTLSAQPINVRLKVETTKQLEQIAKDSKTSLSSIVRSMIETMCISLTKSKNEFIETQIDTIFDTFDNYEKTISVLETSIENDIEAKSQLLKKVEVLKLERMQIRKGMFD